MKVRHEAARTAKRDLLASTAAIKVAGSMPAPLLLEIGVEELPSSFVDAALAALPALVTAKLTALRLSHGAVTALGTPRRLAFIAEDVATAQGDLDEEVVGPPEAAAYKDGAPTRAAEAFATKLGLVPSQLSVVERPASGKQKAGRYVVGRRVEKGRKAHELLGKTLAEVCAEIPFRKSMRWGASEQAFGRPVQWLLALHGDDLVDVAFAGTRSTVQSRGHRFLSPGTFVVKNAGTYVGQLRHHRVLVDRQERATTMMDRVSAAARSAGGTHDPEAYLVDENASLVEEPHVVLGSFDPQYLALPAAVIRAVARGHQKYFCVQKSEDELLPHYVAVANTALVPANVIKGNDRVMRARLADARFFFEEDLKVDAEARVAKLEGIVFHNRLGTVREKVARIERLAASIAGALGLANDVKAQVARAAHLAKGDLVSLMVGEFPELQGQMGRAYAQKAGELPVVADAVRDHYRPVSAADGVAETDVAACVALADRLDTLVGCFAVGLSPTGAADPFALRRACLGILRTLIERSANVGAYATLRLSTLFGLAYDGFKETRPDAKLDLSRADTLAKLEAFTSERLRGLVSTSTSGAVADASMAVAGAAEQPVYAMLRARALQRAVDEQEPWLEKARTVAKRLSGISRDAAPVLHARAVFVGADDGAIVELVLQADAATERLIDEAAVRKALQATHDLADRLDAIFVRTLVNDPADPLTPKRLELLSYGARCMARIADFTRLG